MRDFGQPYAVNFTRLHLRHHKRRRTDDGGGYEKQKPSSRASYRHAHADQNMADVTERARIVLAGVDQ
ncbi:MAG: hypothetical protein ACLUE4_09935 [Acutalibacteraceae bacterium]